MTVDIQSIRKRGATAIVPFYGFEIEATYDPITVMSPGFKAEFNARSKELQAEVSAWIHEFTDEVRKLPLRDDFPGRAILAGHGIETIGDVPVTRKELTELPGIGQVTAQRIINALNTELRVDDTELDRRKEMLLAELALMLVRDWNLSEDGETLPLTVDTLVRFPGLAQAMAAAIWEDCHALGNPHSSNGTKRGLRALAG